MDKLKRCSKCGKELPATTEYFHACKAFKDGLKNKCKKCRLQEHEEYKRAKLNSHICGVYKITNKQNGKVYIGSSSNINSRKNNHFSSLRIGKNPNKNLQEEYILHGEESFTFDVIEIVEDPKELLNREQFWLDYYHSKFPKKIYNLSPTAGSILGYEYPDEVKKKISESRKGIIFTPEHRKNMGLARMGAKSHFYGKHHTETHRRKIASSLIGVNIGENCGTHKLNEAEVIHIRQLLKCGMKTQEIADMFNVSQSNISRIKNRNTWRHI